MSHAASTATKPAQPPKTNCYVLTGAAIDLGTYGCRMLVGMVKDRDVSLISRFSQTVKLEVSPDGILAEPSKHRLIRALAQCHKLIKKHRIRRYRCVGTAACRAIADPEEFTREIKRKTGITLEIISPKEEIRLAAIGAKSLFDNQTSIKFVFDIGGGSSDLGAFEHDRATGNLRCIAHASLPYGILTTAQVSNQSIKDAILCLAQDITSSVLMQCNVPASQMQVISTSGPLATIVTLSKGLRGYHGPHIHGDSISYSDALHWIAQLQQLPREQFNNDYGISHGMLAGLPILRGILNALQTDVYISNAGLRHGMLAELLAQAKKHKHHNSPNQ